MAAGRPIVFMMPALVASALGVVFLTVSLTGYDDKAENIKNTHWMQVRQETSSPLEDKVQSSYAGLQYSVKYVDDEKHEDGPQKLFSKEFKVDKCKEQCANPSKNSDSTNESAAGSTGGANSSTSGSSTTDSSASGDSTAGSSTSDASTTDSSASGDSSTTGSSTSDASTTDSSASGDSSTTDSSTSDASTTDSSATGRLLRVLQSSDQETKEECEETCDKREKDYVATKLCFSSALVACIMFLLASIFSALRINETMNAVVGIKIVSIVVSFLAWVFCLVSWSYYVANPLHHIQENIKEAKCEDIDGLECEVRLGPGLILAIAAWIFAFVSIVSHVVCPVSSADVVEAKKQDEAEAKPIKGHVAVADSVEDQQVAEDLQDEKV